MSSRSLVALGWAIATATAAMALGAVVLIAMTFDRPFFASYAFRGYDVILALSAGGLGGLIVSRRPTHLVGWLLLAAGSTSGLQTLAEQFAVFAYARRIDSPLAALGAWLPQWIWMSSLLAVSLALLLFPDGRLPSRRWRPLAGAIVVGTLAVTALWAIAPPVESTASQLYPVPNVFGVSADSPLRSIAEPSMLVLVVGLLAGFAALALRMRRADALVRQQIKWLMFAALLAGIALALMLVTFMLRLDQVLLKALELATIAGFSLLMAAIAIAILRYRLYDIDVVINRTIVYAAVSAMLVATYAAAVVLFQTVLRPLTGASEFAVALSTLLVVALFQPVRARVRNAVDRRFYRSRYNAARTLDAFAARLRGDLDLDALRSDLVGVMHETVQPAHASVWLREAR